MNEQHDEIIKKLDGINNRLDRVNGNILDLKLWRAYLTGAVAVIVLLGLPILGFIGMQVIKQGNQISGVVARTQNK